MKIKIINGYGWYENLVGSVVNVELKGGMYIKYWNENKNNFNTIPVEDAEVVEEEKKICKTCYFDKFYEITKNCNKVTINKITNEPECLEWKSDKEMIKNKEKETEQRRRLEEKSCKNCGVEDCNLCNDKFIRWQPIEQTEEKSCQTCKTKNNICANTMGTRGLCTANNRFLWMPIESTEGEYRRLKFEDGLQFKATGTTDDATHYQVSDKQPIEIMQSIMTAEQFEGYCLGNVIKYALRMNHKGQKRSDAGKCWQYTKWLVQAMDGKKIVLGDK
jgi:hypothetical protein